MRNQANAVRKSHEHEMSAEILSSQHCAYVGGEYLVRRESATRAMLRAGAANRLRAGFAGR